MRLFKSKKADFELIAIIILVLLLVSFIIYKLLSAVKPLGIS